MIFNSKDTMVKGILMAALLIAMGAPAMAIEEPSYRILETEGEFELRKYSPHIMAETYVEGDFEAVGSEGFRRLADYIGGKEPKKGIHFNDCPRQPGSGIRKNCHDRPS
jgi:hypothetical protein